MASSLPSASAPFQGSVYDDLGVTLGPDGVTASGADAAAPRLRLAPAHDAPRGLAG